MWEIDVRRIDVQYNIWPWSANTPADHYIVYRRTIAGQKQGRRLKASTANETQRVRAGGFVLLQSGTSDGNARKVSEVPGKREGPPTEMRGKCRRYPAKERDLRQIRGEFVGGPSVVKGSGGQRLRSR